MSEFSAIVTTSACEDDSGQLVIAFVGGYRGGKVRILIRDVPFDDVNWRFCDFINEVVISSPPAPIRHAVSGFLRTLPNGFTSNFILPN